jgi:pyruvate kinase
MAAELHRDSLAALSLELFRIREAMLLEERRHERALAASPREAVSQANLLHYMALRRHDIRPLQRALEQLGLSSLGRAEAHALASIDAVLRALSQMGARHDLPTTSALAPTFEQGRELLAAHTEAVLGPAPRSRVVRIMVTLPSEAGRNYAIVREMIASGMDAARINCAHDDAGTWSRMIDNVERGRREVARPCRVMMDLAGPKLRTGALPLVEQKLMLRPDDRLVLTGHQVPGRQDGDGPGASKLRIACTLPEVLPRIREGHRVWFDDGKIGGVVTSTGSYEVTIKVTQAKATGSALRADKGINLPDTDLGLPFLSDKDRADLRFIAGRASVVGLSYVQRPEDLLLLSRELESLGSLDLSVILKIETRQAFEHLPELLLTALGRWPVGVMIARGDLAIEMGYQRLAEIQEEILWISEAAHVPVVWATAVLDKLAKKGIPSRAEITDAAMSQRAECVMLNKGPYVVQAIHVLDDILQRMEAHQRKKTSFLRPLQVSHL